ncbi:DNA damage-inducible protein I [Limnobaculum zhutongyuii]|uniref:DNA damage-inducible protein I n=1 Tax=Limnobaculum zhutongyuii TaxID=2498113 RepID=A0A411WLX8_9GAMM|nr:DinI-like family protein [Limnobaculum zhutongyuii]QBH97146.1 DNA damage-inducible protein I [Limnobaculum zhutongyuii]TQS88405.1 DNA damage-inducible protein I [Limnobaculum zhutongyuii]
MRVEITIDKRNQKQLPSNGLAVVENELQKRLSKKYPGTGIRVRFSSATSISVTGGSKDQSAAVNKIVEQMFEESEDWMSN